jgi:hypothetical protein
MRDNLGPRTNKNKISTTSFKLSKTTLKWIWCYQYYLRSFVMSIPHWSAQLHGSKMWGFKGQWHEKLVDGSNRSRLGRQSWAWLGLGQQGRRLSELSLPHGMEPSWVGEIFVDDRWWGGGLSCPWWWRCERRNPRAPSFEERGERRVSLGLREHLGLEKGHHSGICT